MAAGRHTDLALVKERAAGSNGGGVVEVIGVVQRKQRRVAAQLQVDALQVAGNGSRRTLYRLRPSADGFWRVHRSLRRISNAIDLRGPALRCVLEVSLNALAIAESLDRERATGHVRGPLRGLSVLVKDNLETNDRMQTAASGSIVSPSPDNRNVEHQTHCRAEQQQRWCGDLRHGGRG
jgi:Amidase